MNGYAVKWSPKSKISYFSILEYLDEKWTFKELEAFVNRKEETIDHISKNHLLYPYSKESDAHKCVVVKQVSLFYRIKDNNIELLVF
ncbi:hypothetical protein I5M32_14645 [Pedobacter sp. SD-b]|uniref:Uncharacterized protein n=1 Tax=Pedobacter segetis TaxID=2793069 RepID=A0ABS1BPG5_9SPHI|nr:hypothetical protein [Pedobacter segetis]MBK0384204.1 hypothetical protein [Pedobacter segetis]